MNESSLLAHEAPRVIFVLAMKLEPAWFFRAEFASPSDLINAEF